MAIDLEKALEASKKIMLEKSFGDWQKPVFSTYGPSYFMTSEKLNTYLKELELKGKKALSVLSSGDHNFNLIAKGVEYIDTYDVNQLAYFIYYLKYTMICSSSLKEFKQLESQLLRRDDLKAWNEMLIRLREFAPTDVCCYYEELVRFNEFLSRTKGEKNLFPYLCLVPQAGSYANLYDANSENFETLKANLERAQVHFIFENVLNLPKVLNQAYDVILLSNIADYLFDLKNSRTSQAFMRYIASFEPILAEDGTIINYFFGDYGGTNLDRQSLQLEGFDTQFVLLDRNSTDFEDHAYYLARKKQV